MWDLRRTRYKVDLTDEEIALVADALIAYELEGGPLAEKGLATGIVKKLSETLRDTNGP